MATVFRRLLDLLAGADDSQLAAQMQLQNEILRSKLPKYISVTAQERERLVRFGKLLGSAVSALLSIVTPRTFARWIKSPVKSGSNAESKADRPCTEVDIRDLIARFAPRSLPL